MNNSNSGRRLLSHHGPKDSAHTDHGLQESVDLQASIKKQLKDLRVAVGDLYLCIKQKTRDEVRVKHYS
jgi:Spy/CpxP family protein refolding chaperone